MKIDTGGRKRNNMATAIPRIDREACIACGACADYCPGGAVHIRNGKAEITDPEACTYCTDCEAVCPTGAIQCPFFIIMADQDD